MKKNVGPVAMLASAAIIGSLSFYSYLTPGIWLQDVKEAAQEGDKDRLRDLIEFDSVKSSLKEDIKASVATSMRTELKDNPFAALGLAIGAMMVDPIVEMMVSPSGITALIEKGQVEDKNKNASIPAPRSIESKSNNDGLNIERGYDSFSKYRIRIRPENKTTEPIVFTLNRESFFSWKLTRISLPQDLLQNVGSDKQNKKSEVSSNDGLPQVDGLPQRPKLISVEATDMSVLDSENPNVILFTATLRNRAGYTLAFPAIDLVLLNKDDRTLARRVYTPMEYFNRVSNIKSGFADKSEILVRLTLNIGNLDAAQFRFAVLPLPNREEREMIELNPELIKGIAQTVLDLGVAKQ